MINIKRFSLMGILWLIIITTSAQHRLAGIITDKNNNEPLIGANIYLEGTTYGAASGKEGKYEITNIPNGTYILRVSYHGYKTEEIKLEIYQHKSSVHFRMEENSIDLNAIVVTGTRTEKQISNSPVLTQIIGQKAIKTQGITYLPQVLTHNNASFEMVKDNTVNSFKFGGLGAPYTLFLIDGERIAGETKGAIDLSRINPASIERIEIIKGAASTLYGSNAIGGVVNIITKDVSRPLEISGGVQTTLFKDPSNEENRSEEYAYANVNLTRGKLSSFTNAKFNNYAPYDINGGAGVLGLLTQENEDNYHISQKLVFRANDKWSFDGHAAYYHLDRNYQLQGYNDKKSDDFTYGMKATYLPWEDAKLELSWHSDHNKIYDVVNLGTEKKDSLDYDNLFQNARLLGNFKLGSFNDLTVGAEYIREQQSSLQNSIDSKVLENYVVYLQDEISITKDISFVAGARTEFHSSYGTHFTPQLSAMFSPGKFTFRGNYGEGFRAPSVKELYTIRFEIPAHGAPMAFFLDGNPDLEPETSRYISGSAQFSDEKIDVSVSYAINNVDQLISSTDSFSVIMDFQSIPPMPKEIDYVYSNVDEARIKTLNLLARYHILNGLSFSASYIYTDAKNLTTDEVLPNVRKHNVRFNLDFNHSFKKYSLTANLNASYFGTKKAINIYTQDNELIELSDFTLWRFMTTHTFKDHYTLKIGVNNLFDKTDDQPEFFNLTSPGRMMVLGLSVNF